MLITSSFLLLHYQEESLKQTILKGVDGQAITAAYGIESFINEGLKDARAISSALPVETILRGNPREINPHLKKMFETFPKFMNGIFILDREGKFVADYPSHPELRGKSFAFREYYQRTIQNNQGAVSKPYTSMRTKLPVLTFTAPVRDANDRLIAIVACSANLIAQEALGVYRKQKFGKTGYLFVFDRSRRLVLHPDDKRLMTSVEEGKNRIMEAALKGFEGGGETVNSQGVPMLLAVRPVPNADWIVAVQVTQAEAYAPVAEARIRIIFVSGIALLLVIIIGAVAIRRVTKPLQQLERVASQIGAELDDAEAKGAYNLAASALDTLKTIRSRDEIGLLAASFLRLATKLKLTLDSLQHAAEDWQRTFNSVNEAVVTLDLDGRITRMNHTAIDWFRTSSEKAQGQYAYQVLFGMEAPPKDWPAISLLVEHQNIRWSQDLDKPFGTFEFTITPITVFGMTTVFGTTTGAVLIINDITERVKSESQVREMAFYDALTGFPNRFLLQDRIQQAIASASRSGKKAGIMFIDLDRFKEINDRYGHDVGDEVLRQVAKRISGCLRMSDTLSRLGGDEFVVVLQDISQQSEAATIAERIIETRATPLIIHGHALTISSSIGIAFFPDDDKDSEALLKKADMAMYRAKGRGRGTFEFFS